MCAIQAIHHSVTQTNAPTASWQQKKTHSERFLSLMDETLPWSRLVEEVNYYCADLIQEMGYSRTHLETMLRIYFVQDWFGMSDSDTEDALWENLTIRSFVGSGLELHAVPAATMIAAFRISLERRGVADKLITVVDRYLTGKRYFLTRGTALSPMCVKVDDNSGQLRKLSGYFNSIKPPYGIKEIYQFNSIYEQIYPYLNLAEKHRAENYVEAMLEGVQSPDYASRIFGVV